MKSSYITRSPRRIIILCVVLVAAAALPLLSSARSSNTTSNSITIVNDSSRSIRYVYLSHATADDWSGDQLGGAGIPPGQSATVNNVSCDQAQIKVIGEDQDGCFVSGVVDCGGESTWTITNSTAADCGS